MALGISREQERQDDHSPRQQAPIYEEHLHGGVLLAIELTPGKLALGSVAGYLEGHMRPNQHRAVRDPI
jgi:hypothetical protein